MLRHSICVSLYKIQIVLTNHNSTNSKWHQYNQTGATLYISGLSTKVEYKRKCFQGSSPYYTLQLVRNFKTWGSIQDSRIKKKGKARKEPKEKVEAMSQSLSNITIFETLACSRSLLYFETTSEKRIKNVLKLLTAAVVPSIAALCCCLQQLQPRKMIHW